MVDCRRNVWVTLQAPPVHCSLVACPLNMFVQRVLVWTQVSFRTSARLEQCSLTITPGQWMETYKGIKLLLSKVCYLGLSSLCSVKIEVIVMWLQKDSASTKTSVSGIFFITMLV